MNNAEFNKSLFVRNDDDIFKVALMITKYEEIPKSIQEILFFSGKSAVYNGFNYLSFTESFNDLLIYSNKWLQDLNNINDEYDWFLHRTKLKTKFDVMSYINKDTYNYIINLFDKNKNEQIFIQNSIVIWNNSITINNKNSYKEEKEITWDLWKILKQYKNKDLTNIIVNEKIQYKLNEIIKYRDKNDFYKKYNLTLSDENKKQINKIKKDLEIIYLSQDLKKEMTNLGKLRKIFKI